MKYCNQCGNQLEDSAAFCTRCGFQFANNVQPSYAQNAYASAGGYPTTAMQQGKPVKTGPTGLSIAAFILSFFIPLAGLIMGIVDLAKKSGRKKGLSIAAVILSSFGLLWMLLLVGIMAPSLTKYIEKTNVSSDIQLCDTVRMAITTAMMDPSVIAGDYDSIRFFSDGEWHSVTALGGGGLNGTLNGAVYEIIGFDPYDIESHINSSYNGGKASNMQFRIVNGNQVEVRIENSDSLGRKGSSGADPISVP